MATYKEHFDGQPKKNRFLFDYLTVNIKDMYPEQVIDLLCSKCSNPDMIKENFYYHDTGVLTGYNNSYRFLQSRFISISWRNYTDVTTGEIIDVDKRQGVALNITGTGCRFFTVQDFVILFTELINNHDCNFTRLDVAFDDFTGMIPHEEIISSLDTWTGTNKVVSTRARLSNFRIYKNFSQGSVSNSSFGYNFDLGSNGSSMKVRMYDKKVEQNRNDLSYWKRFELQLRREKAINFIYSFMETGSFAIPFAEYLSNFMRFLVDNDVLGNDLDKVKTAPFWDSFIQALKDFDSLKYTFKE